MNEQTTGTTRPTPTPAARILMLLLMYASATLTGILPDLMTSSLLAVIPAALFAYCFLLTFSPLVFTASAAAAITASVIGGSFYCGLQALLYLPVALSLCISMLRLRNKTQTVISAAISLTVSVCILFLIGYMMRHGTIAPDALKQSFNGFFENVRAQMTETLRASFDAMREAASQTPGGLQGSIFGEAAANQNAAADPLEIEAAINALVDLTVTSMKLSFPALVAVYAQVLAYCTVGLYLLLTRILSTKWMRPRTFTVTVSKLAAVIFVVAYIINMIPQSSTLSLSQIAAANLATMLMPGVFLMGIKSLVHRAHDPKRRRSFFVSATIIAILLFISPAYSVFFVIIDGIGEIFFDGKTLI